MLAITQHGAEAHYIRPDGVMRSSIIRAIPGYQPVENAQAVALRFTQPHYFATTLSGARGLGASGIPLWQQIRLRISSALARAQAAAVMRRAAAINGLGGFHGSDVPYEVGASLPTVVGPGRYGYLNANEQMAHIAMRITAGIAPTGLVPDVAQTQMQAAAAVAPNVTAEPARLASMVNNYVTGDVATAAYGRAMNFFNRLRMWWFG